MSIKPLSYHGFSLDFLVAGSNREKEGKRPGDNMAWQLNVSVPERPRLNYRTWRQLTLSDSVSDSVTTLTDIPCARQPLSLRQWD